ncbi:hypothetical protein Salat_0452600 [Sesamum alatum]|uniref:Senescence regulator n=1 Tax=Sesamum alatum TaxID=300844 RepID=A0AAE1Z3A6_9LAMI|nr:hypothetical protein Salat_0452600 [Sesamum alatum]
MAAPRSYFGRSNYRFLPIDHGLSNDSIIFELDESDVWNSGALSPSPELRNSTSRVYRKRSAAARATSLPVNVPDWSKILKEEYRESRLRDIDGDDYDEEPGSWIPPHEFLARARIAASSVHEGRGRNLNGRDLRRVRNAIWQKIGFQD